VEEFRDARKLFGVSIRVAMLTSIVSADKMSRGAGVSLHMRAV
jgi:hypothetical protein